MAIPLGLNSREYHKFIEDAVGRVAVRTIGAQNRQVIADLESVTGITAGADTTGLATSTNHREGTLAVTFSKSGVGATTGSISATITSVNLIGFEDGRIRFYINLPGVVDVASVRLRLGTDASNYAEWVVTTAGGPLVAGWNQINVESNTPTTQTGTGIAWGAVTYWQIAVVLNAAGNTLAGIITDALSALYSPEVRPIVQDVEIGAIEIKDGSSDQRAVVEGTGALRVAITPGATVSLVPTSGQVVVAAGPTQAPLSAVAAQADEVVVIAHLTNAANIFLGPTGVTSANGLIMEPGRSVVLHSVDLNAVFINGTVGQGVSWFRLT